MSEHLFHDITPSWWHEANAILRGVVAYWMKTYSMVKSVRINEERRLEVEMATDDPDYLIGIRNHAEEWLRVHLARATALGYKRGG